MTRRRGGLARLQRDLYLASRATGDVRALQRGRYLQRRARRVERRTLLGWLYRNTGL